MLPTHPMVAALSEALPYVQRWAGSTLVVKYGGSAMGDERLADALMQDLVLLQAVGVRTILVHGGGAAVSEMGRRLGLSSRFVDGLRVTDEDTMRIAQQVQIGGISRDIVAALGRRGGKAIGLSGHDCGGWLRGRQRTHRSRETGEPVDLGRVGDISAVNVEVIDGLLSAGLLPVVAPVAVDGDLRSLNVNADSIATAIASAVGASRLIFLSDVSGIHGPDGAPAPVVSAATLRGWMAEGVVTGGMIPKAEACLSAIGAGVRGVTVADGRVPHAVLIELFTDEGVGSMVVPENP